MLPMGALIFCMYSCRGGDAPLIWPLLLFCVEAEGGPCTGLTWEFMVDALLNFGSGALALLCEDDRVAVLSAEVFFLPKSEPSLLCFFSLGAFRIES